MIAAIYARKSTEQPGVAEGDKSVTRQIAHARAYAVAKGWTVAAAHIYSDDGISGAEFANRPGFLRLMNALKPTPPFQVLIMSEEARLGREAIETAYALKQLVTAGVHGPLKRIALFHAQRIRWPVSSPFAISSKGPFKTCPQCGAQEFGVYGVHGCMYRRRCRACWHGAEFPLWPLSRKIIYIDQFAISDMMKTLNSAHISSPNGVSP